MNLWFVSAGLLSLITALIHVFLGGPEIHDVVQGSDLSLMSRSVSAVVWHFVTALLIINGALMILAAFVHKLVPAVLLSVVQYVAFGAIFIAYDIARYGDLLAMPQWTLFGLISLCALVGVLRSRRAPSQRF